MNLRTMHHTNQSAKLVNISIRRVRDMIDTLNTTSETVAMQSELLHACDVAIHEWEHVGFLAEQLTRALAHADTAETQEFPVIELETDEVSK
jgi:hypothetical protein